MSCSFSYFNSVGERLRIIKSISQLFYQRGYLRQGGEPQPRRVVPRAERDLRVAAEGDRVQGGPGGRQVVAGQVGRLQPSQPRPHGAGGAPGGEDVVRGSWVGV